MWLGFIVVCGLEAGPGVISGCGATVRAFPTEETCISGVYEGVLYYQNILEDGQSIENVGCSLVLEIKDESF